MSQIDPRIFPMLDTAQLLIDAAAMRAVSAALKLMPERADGAPNARERGRILFAKTQLHTRRDALLGAFRAALRANFDDEVRPTTIAPLSAPPPTDWEAIGLVDEDRIEERLSVERIGSFITHECEAELRTLNAYLSTLMGRPVTDPELNPLRANVVGQAMHQAIESAVDEPSVRRIIETEVGKQLAGALHEAYAAVIEDLKSRGIRRAELVARPVEQQTPPAGAAGATPHEESMRNWERSMIGRPIAEVRDSLRRWEASMASGRAAPSALYAPPGAHPGAPFDDVAGLLDRLMRGATPGWPGSGAAPAAGTGHAETQAAGQAHPQIGAPADPALMGLLRRLTGGLESARIRPDEARGFTAGSGLVAAAVPPVNLIRAHRELLEQQSPGKIDQMVIEVVGTLFDQILSDPQVPPQMAHQIARLQLPVLRIALRDSSLFALRRHPVRRFINRVASLATATDDFEAGPGKELLARVRALVDEIVEGDFEQVGLYGDKLLALEHFGAEQARVEADASTAAVTLRNKEREWVLLSHFSQHLSAALEPLAVAAHLKEFIASIWAEVILRASQTDGEHSTLAQRSRATGVDLLVSVLPQRTLDERKHFLNALPGLMARLNEGLAWIEWPKAASEAFFGKLMSDHAASLKHAPPSELDYNLLVKRFQAAMSTPVPESIRTARSAGAPQPAGARAIEQHFSAAQARSVGLLDEAALEPDEGVDIVLDLPDLVGLAAGPSTGAAALSSAAARPALAAPSGTLAFDAPDSTADGGPVHADDAAPPVDGPRLRDHLELGFSYQLQMNGSWQKLRLTYMSPARNFFMFTHGAKNLGSISMTSRMLDRLCSRHRLKAFESAALLDRATERARAQLATLVQKTTPPAAALSMA